MTSVLSLLRCPHFLFLRFWWAGDGRIGRRDEQLFWLRRHECFVIICTSVMCHTLDNMAFEESGEGTHDKLVCLWSTFLIKSWQKSRGKQWYNNWNLQPSTYLQDASQSPPWNAVFLTFTMPWMNGCADLLGITITPTYLEEFPATTCLTHLELDIIVMY